MPVDWNDRAQVEQALIKARNAGVSDEDFAAYAKEKRASLAGTTLQKAKRETAFDINQSRPILSAGQADVIPPGQYQKEALPYILGAPGQALKELGDYLTAEKPEDRPSLQGAALRVGAQVAAPKAVEYGGRLLGKTVGFAGPAVQRALASTGQAMRTMYGKVAQGAEEQLGTEIATQAGKRLQGLQGSALAKDAFISNLDEQGNRIPVEKLASKMQEAVTEASTFGGDMAKQARGRLGELADELLSKRQNGTLGLGEYMAFKENLGKQLMKATNPILRQRLGSIGQAMDEELIQTLGPGAANHIKVLEQATANRLSLLRKTVKVFKANPGAVIRNAAKNDTIMRMLNELEGQFGMTAADDTAMLAAKKTFHPKDMPIVNRLLDKIVRIGASGAIGIEAGGPAAFLTYLATSPAMRRQAAKLGLLLSTTSIPQMATAAVTNAYTRPPEETPEPAPK